MSSHNSQDPPARGRSRGRGGGRGRCRSRARSCAQSMSDVTQACDTDPALGTLSTRTISCLTYSPKPTELSEAPSQSVPVDHNLDLSQVFAAEFSSDVTCSTSTSPTLLFYNILALTSDASIAKCGEPRTSVSAEATSSLDPSTSPTKIQSTSQKFPPQSNLEDVVTQGNINDRKTSPQSHLIDLAISIQRSIDNVITRGFVNNRTIPTRNNFNHPISQGDINRHITQGDVRDQTTPHHCNHDDLTSSLVRNTDSTSFPQSNINEQTYSAQSNSNNRTPTFQRDVSDTTSSQGYSNDLTSSLEINLEEPTSCTWQSNPHDSTLVPQSNVDNLTSFPNFSPQTNPIDATSPPSQRSLTELCNPYNVDFAFEFLALATGRCLGLWAHQSVLVSSSGAFASLFGLPNIPDTSPICSRRFYEYRVRISDFSLIAHCALLRFLYTSEEGEVPDQIDLRDYVLTPIPVIPWMVDDVIDVILEPVYTTPWCELLVLASRYHLDSTLGFLCQEKIIAGLTFMDAVPTLLMFGAHCPGMKAPILDWCARAVLRVYNAMKNPEVRSLDQPMLWAIVAGMFDGIEDSEVVAEVSAEISLAIESVAKQLGGSV